MENETQQPFEKLMKMALLAEVHSHISRIGLQSYADSLIEKDPAKWSAKMAYGQACNDIMKHISDKIESL